MKSLVRMAATVALTGALLAACSNSSQSVGPSQSAAPSSAASETATSSASGGSGSIVIALPQAPAMLEPAQDGTIEFKITRNVVEGLVNRDPVTGDIVPELAKSWEQTAPNTWRFTLQDGVTYSNGEPFNAEAAAYGINRATDKVKNLHVAGTVTPMTAKAIDDLTLEVSTEDPSPVLPRDLYYVLLPAPEATGDRVNINDPIGTGPYVLGSFDPSQEAVLERNPNYWGGAADIASVKYVWRQESSVLRAMVDQGEADIAVGIAPQDASGDNISSVVIPETPYLRFDMNCPALADIRVRQAINYAIDRSGLSASIFGGFATPASQLITSDVTGYNDSLQPTSFDVAKAKALIAAAAADGVPVDTELNIIGRLNIYANSTEAMEAVQSMLTEAGLKVKLTMLETAPWAEYLLRDPEKPAPDDRCAIVQSSHGNEAGDAGSTVRNAYRSDGLVSTLALPHVDDLEAAARVTQGDARQTAYADIFKYLADDVVPDAPIVHIKQIYALADRIDWKPRPDGLILVKDIKLK